MEEVRIQDEVEMLPEYFSQRAGISVVFVMPQKESFLESTNKETPPAIQEQDLDLKEQLKTPKKEDPQPKKSAKGITNSYLPRRIFTDGWNSMWHFIFGLLAVKFTLLTPLFVAYQFLDVTDINLPVDIYEFFLGYFFGWLYSLV